MLLTMVLVIIVLSNFTMYALLVQTAHARPYVRDTTLDVEPAVRGLSFPTSMAFLDNNNILVLEKEGNVRLVANGTLHQEPLLRLPVNSQALERGLLGIAVVNNSGGADVDNAIVDVLLYFTEADPLRNRVYKYQWNGQSLINPTLILDFPAEPGPIHNGGRMVIGPDGYLYLLIGDLTRNGQLQNFRDGPPPDDTSVILRVNPEDGSAAPGNPFANSENKSLSKYYAYGIRNSFGMDFDPLTGNLWDTENGNEIFDELNLVRPGFNSGWKKVLGGPSSTWMPPGVLEHELVNFPGSNYSDPVLSWREVVALTDLEFFTSSKLGAKYTNNIFVGDWNRGNLYFFKLNQTRDGIEIDTIQKEAGLSDLVVDSAVIKGTAYISEEELSAITFGNGFGASFGGISDIETGPDGFLYVLSFGDGIIYKISPSVNAMEKADAVHTQRIPWCTPYQGCSLSARYTDEPFATWFYIAGVDNNTGYIVNSVTANNVTRTISYNASEVDLVDTNAKDGLIEASVPLPNGTIPIGDKYKACTIVPKYMYQYCNIGFNSPTLAPESVSVMIPSLNGTTNPELAQGIQKIEESPFTTMFRIAGVDNDTGYVVNWVTANNVTNVSFYNASQLDLQSNLVDGFTEIGVTLPNGTMHIGDKYKACTKILKDDYLVCNEGFNWPGGRAEYNSIILP